MLSSWELNRLLVEQAHLIRKFMLTYRHVVRRERRETSVTEEFVLRIKERGGDLVTVMEAPDEPKTGADLELWLRGGGLLLGLRFQAKSLHPRKRKADIYKYLHHAIGRQQIPQVNRLVEGTLPPLNPGHLFYNALESKPQSKSACCSFNG